VKWSKDFDAIAAAMVRAASERSVDAAVAEAERQGLIKQSGGEGTYQDKIWEKTDEGTTLRFRWHTYDPSHAWRASPDVNVLSLELRQSDKVLRHVNERFDD
jgi:hypothetical protein